MYAAVHFRIISVTNINLQLNTKELANHINLLLTLYLSKLLTLYSSYYFYNFK